MLNTAGKLLEEVICSKLEEYTEGENWLHNMQYGFRKRRRSAIDTVILIRDIASNALAGQRWINWDNILLALGNKQIPKYLWRIILKLFSKLYLI